MANYAKALFKQSVPIYFLDFKYYKLNANTFCAENFKISWFKIGSVISRLKFSIVRV